MKVEDCIVSVERRTVGGCIDLALVFARHFAWPIAKLTLAFAVPCSLLIWIAADAVRRDMLIPSIIVFAFFTMLASGALVAAVGPQVFGVPISTGQAMKSLIRRSIPYVVLGILFRVVGFCMFFPVLFVLAWGGHLPEVMFLEMTPVSQVSSRLSWLTRRGGYSRNLGRLITITGFWMVFAVGLFLLIDILSGLLFNMPVFFGTISFGPDLGKAFQSRLIDDPTFIVVLQASLWITWPIARLAWFFCYLDQRIRNECWDLDLQIRAESRRLEEQVA